jgi:hypothetical protein
MAQRNRVLNSPGSINVPRLCLGSESKIAGGPGLETDRAEKVARAVLLPGQLLRSVGCRCHPLHDPAMSAFTPTLLWVDQSV